MSIVIQLASWAATAYLSYSFYQTGRYVYSLWTPPQCDPLENINECFCGSYSTDTSFHMEIYLSSKKKLSDKFQSSTQFKQIYSSIYPTNELQESSPIKLSFNNSAIIHKTVINGYNKPYKLHKNKSHIYAHIVSYIVPKSKQQTNYYYSKSSPPRDTAFSHLKIPITYLSSPPPNTFSLSTAQSETNHSNIKKKLVEKVQYFQPNLTIFYVIDFNCYPIKQIPSDLYHHLSSSHIRHKNKQQKGYAPIIFVSDLFGMHKYALPIMDANGDLLSNTNHTEYIYNLSSLPFKINIEGVSLGLFRLYLMMDASNKMMATQWGFTRHDSDQIKGLFVDTPPLLTLATFTAAMLHSIFGVLAMKSDINFWYTKDGVDSLRGLSTNSVFFEAISSIIITIYLIDSDQTNKIVIAFMAAECLLGLWKIKRILDINKKVKFKESIADYEISDSEDSDSGSDSDTDSDSNKSEKIRGRKKSGKNKNKINPKKSAKKTKKNDNNSSKIEESANVVIKTETESLDKKATKIMLLFMIPSVIIYGIYSFFYHKHKSLISFIINVSASCVYGLGFIHLTPQLFINYELKSVDSLPWRVLIYRFFNTFVDDLFSFVIDMPLMHRLACFRDDIVFICFLIQWWYYGSKKRKID